MYDYCKQSQCLTIEANYDFILLLVTFNQKWGLQGNLQMKNCMENTAFYQFLVFNLFIQIVLMFNYIMSSMIILYLLNLVFGKLLYFFIFYLIFQIRLIDSAAKIICFCFLCFLIPYFYQKANP